MDPPEPFPILRLPFLAIEEVFKSLHPIEIINFSLISNRTKQITKMMTVCPKYLVALDIDKNLQIDIRGTNETISCIYVMTSEENVDGETEEIDEDGCINRKIYKYSKDPVDEWKQLSIYVLEIFKTQTIDVFTMYLDLFVDQNKSIIDFLKTNVKSIDECILSQRKDEINVDEDFGYLLDNLKINDMLYSMLNIKDDNFDGKIPRNLKHLIIKHANWIGYEKLLEIDSVTVDIWKHRISNKDWNLFIKKWMAMETHFNLEILEFELNSFEDFRELILHDIPHEEVAEEVKRTLITELVLHDIPHEVVDEDIKRTLNMSVDQGSYGSPREISGGIDIKRIDGKTATFSVHHTEWGDNF
ncbi:hypothetical protein CRE_30512 [Caenorhabditis remanei]|uniref:F-box domain-containing protein n=1 Tax=Caenorhabditis remanei TaxID=31234 RepID=E3NI66_CAERE|nr:hypothetical protein CRE_30512 [Caenorhabditis remanei]